VEGLWDRKRKMVAQTPGVTIYSGKETFNDLGGLSNIKEFFRRFITGRRSPKAIFFTDEIEKQMGSQGDLSGMQQMQLGKLLSWSQEKAADGHMKVAGALCIGHPGAGKSAIAKALGNEAGCPTIICDLGDTKNSLVGASEERMASMLQVVDAVGQGSILWIATCNGVEQMKPEFLSRFQLGQFFFDLPDAEEREAIWQVYLRKYDLDPKQPRPNDEGWVGREIEAVCYKAWMLNMTLQQAGAYMVIGSVANSARVQALRQSATGNYLSATYEGLYRVGRESRTRPAFTEPKAQTRSITV
jgi:SpoVK/Ycf46/Vps4 family AAA+-type ATPase